MSRAFNTVTFLWSSTDADPTIVNDPTWIVDPVFDDEGWADQIGPKFWSYPGGNSIATPSASTYAAEMVPINQAAIWELIQAERDRRKLDGGYMVPVLGVNKWFHSDDTSRIQQIGLVMFGANMPSGIAWKTMDDSFITMTPTIAGQIFQAAAVSDTTIFTIAEMKREAMIALSDPTTYTGVYTGWPTCFLDL